MPRGGPASAPAGLAAVCLAAVLRVAAAGGDGRGGDGVALLQSGLEVSRSEAAHGFSTGGNAAQASYRQRLLNVGDAQYLAYVRVGNQTISGLADTSCADFMVFSTSCSGCGMAAVYHPELSRDYSEGSLRVDHSHGGGVTHSQEVRDWVQLGNYSAGVAPFWMITRAEMDVDGVAFASVLGLGPPEMPAARAWGDVKGDVDRANSALDDARMPSEARLNSASTDLAVAKEVDAMRSPLGFLGVGAFSLCLGRAPGSDGFLVWGDDRRTRSPGLFRRVPVLGPNAWSVAVTGVRMVRKSDGALMLHRSGCPGGCAGAVVSSTPLLELPPSTLDAITAQIGAVTPETCSGELSQLPDLVFEVGDATVTLPPTAYVSRSKCALLLAAAKDESTVTLGAPFLREYYTTFVLGEDRADRALFIAPASEQCEPAAAGTA